jgi:hypothetical protein
MLSKTGSLFVVAALTVAATGCSERDRVHVPAFQPSSAGQQALGEYDTNKDGFLDGAELERCPGLKQGIALIDQDRDGKLTADEIRDRFAQYFEHKIGLYPLGVIVTLNGRALEGATVTVVPEAFAGSALRPVSGVTDAGGNCTFLVEGQSIPGVAPGVYRVEVSKKDAAGRETVAEKYNTKTTLGFELGGGSDLAKGGHYFVAVKSK